jgi:hypothetical protein
VTEETAMSYPGWDTIRNSTYARTRYFPMLDADEPTFLGQPHAFSAADLEGADAVIIGAPYVASWTEYDPSKAYWNLGVPLHPGAERYYREQDWLR